MTPAQLTALKAAILAETDATLVAARTAGRTGEIAAFYNTPATPSFTVWRSSMSLDEVYAALVWTEMSTRTAQQLATFQVLLLKGTVDPRSANIRQAFADLFTATTTLTNLTAAAKRTVTRGERLFATGTGSSGSPGAITFEGRVTNEDVVAALAS